jgi:hypothetical protein
MQVDAQDTVASEAVNAVLYERHGDFGLAQTAAESFATWLQQMTPVNVREQAGLFQERVRGMFEDDQGHRNVFVVKWTMTPNSRSCHAICCGEGFGEVLSETGHGN